MQIVDQPLDLPTVLVFSCKFCYTARELLYENSANVSYSTIGFLTRKSANGIWKQQGPTLLVVALSVHKANELNARKESIS
jgi:hypothetical protein